VGPASGVACLRVAPGARARWNGEKVAGRGDTVRLWSGERLRRVWRHWGERRSKLCFGRADFEARNVANLMAGCGVQQTRRASMRRKPSKSGGTTGTERARRVAASRRRSTTSSEVVFREWTRDVFVGGGAIFETWIAICLDRVFGPEQGPRGSRDGSKAREGTTSWLRASEVKQGHQGGTHGPLPTTKCARAKDVGKANDLLLARASMRPRCDSGCSCDDISRLKTPPNLQGRSRLRAAARSLPG
jgi:hypothetical protein